jgi:hypothetical protein
LSFRILWYSICLVLNVPVPFEILNSIGKTSWKPLGSPHKIVMSGCPAV